MVEHFPVKAMEDTTRQKGHQSNKAKDNKIMGCLDCSFLTSSVGFSEEGCGANVHEVPAETEEQESDGEMFEAGAG